MLVNREGELLQSLVVMSYWQKLSSEAKKRVITLTNLPPRWGRRVSRSLRGTLRSMRGDDPQRRSCLLEGLVILVCQSFVIWVTKMSLLFPSESELYNLTWLKIVVLCKTDNALDLQTSYLHRKIQCGLQIEVYVFLKTQTTSL